MKHFQHVKKVNELYNLLDDIHHIDDRLILKIGPQVEAYLAGRLEDILYWKLRYQGSYSNVFN